MIICRTYVCCLIFGVVSGIYIHIPFCKQKCAYCDFHFSTTFGSYREKMIQMLTEELVLRKNYLPDGLLRSVYFGGGTPSLLSHDELVKIIGTVREHFSLEDQIEITLEANPDDIVPINLISWKNAGINRLSIGIQSFRQVDLDWMNRAHSACEAERAVKLSQDAGFENLTVDLIYGLPDLGIAEWKDHLEKVTDMGIDHISAYCLTVEDNTPLHRWVKKGKIKTASEETQSDQYLLMVEYLASRGYEQYEISNFARNGRYAVHNSAYWTGASYLGVGPSAHSFNGIERRWNVANNSKYMLLMGSGNDWFETEQLTKAEKWNEMIMTGLRTIFGVDLGKLAQIATISVEWIKIVNEFETKGWLTNKENRITLTTEGKLKADYIATELFFD